MNSYELFRAKCEDEIRSQGTDTELQALSRSWIQAANSLNYSYHLEWLGRPIIQYPQDIVAMQELIWSVKPDLIIETGIAHGGSLVFSASMLALLDYCEAVEKGQALDTRCPSRRVLGVDIDIRKHNRSALEAHPIAHRIEMIQGSSIEPDIIAKVHGIAEGHRRILVCLDSNHTQEHVIAELEAYAPLTSKGSYCVVFDTIIEDFPQDPARPWGPGNNPKSAVKEYLRRLKEEGRTAADGSSLSFATDKLIENKLLITVAPDGYLKRI